MGCLENKQNFARFPPMDIDLDTKVREALIARRGDWQAIAAASGVSHSWLSKFANGHIPNPGYATLKRLASHLLPPSVVKPAIPTSSKKRGARPITATPAPAAA